MMMHLSSHERCDLKDSGSGNSGVVGDGGVAGGEDGVDLTVGASVANGDSCVDLAVLDDSRGEHGSVSQREGDVERASRDGHASSKVELNGSTLDKRRGSVGTSGQCGESLDGKGRVGCRAGLDEGSCERVDLVEVEGDIERLRRGLESQAVADERAVTGLDGQDAASGGQVCLVGDEGSSTEVGAHTDTLEDLSSGNESGRGEVAEVVCAGVDGSDTSTLESGGQEVNMDLLITTDLLEVSVELRAVEASGSEVLLGELGDTLGVEGCLEVLESQGVVEDDTIDVSALTLDKGRSSSGNGGQEGSAEY